MDTLVTLQHSCLLRLLLFSFLWFLDNYLRVALFPAWWNSIYRTFKPVQTEVQA